MLVLDDFYTESSKETKASKSISYTTFYYKNGQCVSINSYGGADSYNLDENLMPVPYIDKVYYKDEITYRYSYDENGVLIKEKLNGNFNKIGIGMETYATYRENINNGLLLVNPLKLAIMADIKNVTFDGIDCYSIKMKDKDNKEHIFIFEKETGLLRKKDTVEYYYIFNVVNDAIFEMPYADEKEECYYTFNIPIEDLQ